MYCELEVLEELAVFMSQAPTGQEVIRVHFPRKTKLKSNKHEMASNLFLIMKRIKCRLSFWPDPEMQPSCKPVTKCKNQSLGKTLKVAASYFGLSSYWFEYNLAYNGLLAIANFLFFLFFCWNLYQVEGGKFLYLAYECAKFATFDIMKHIRLETKRAH